MFAVIYRFKVKENQDLKFQKAWEGLTKLIYQFEGSLGSRLHKSKNSEYIAYAQWPSKEIWKNAGDNMPKEADVHRVAMKESCSEIETIYELEPTHDLLQNNIYS